MAAGNEVEVEKTNPLAKPLPSQYFLFLGE
jgi:hypothetical protein